MEELHTPKTLLKEINRVYNLEFWAMMEGKPEEKELTDLRYALQLERAAMLDALPKKTDVKSLFKNDGLNQNKS